MSYFGSIDVTKDVETIRPICRISIRVCSLNINPSEIHFSFMEMEITDLYRYVKISFTAILVQSVLQKMSRQFGSMSYFDTRLLTQY